MGPGTGLIKKKAQNAQTCKNVNPKPHLVLLLLLLLLLLYLGHVPLLQLTVTNIQIPIIGRNTGVFNGSLIQQTYGKILKLPYTGIHLVFWRVKSK